MTRLARFVFSSLSAFLVLLLSLSPAFASAGDFDAFPEIQQWFAGADRFERTEGEPPALAAYQGEELLGYAFFTEDLLSIPAYSGKPVHMLVGLDAEGRYTGIRVTEHHEPILLVGIPEESLDTFVDQYVGKALTDHIVVGASSAEGYTPVDAITGATVTVMVMNQSLGRATRQFAKAYDLLKGEAALEIPPATVKPDVFAEADWIKLTGDGSIRRMNLSFVDVDKAFRGTDGDGVRDPGCHGVLAECGTFIDMYYTLLTPPTIGRNLLGEFQYNGLMAELEADEHAIAVMASGEYSFRGNGFVRGGIFDRVQMHQDGRIIQFRDLDYTRLSDVFAAGMPKFEEMAIFVIRVENEFDPGKPFSLELLVRRQIGPLESVFTSFFGDYAIPESYIDRPAPPKVAVPLLMEEGEATPLWVTIWEQNQFKLVVLGIGLFVVTMVLMFQDILVQYPKLLHRLRHAFLVYTVVFIGWYALAQLSVVNVLTFVHAFMTDFRWETFLVDPLIFVLWGYVAATLLLWGRGVFCGWLCPFGAAQELINQVARFFKVPQLELPRAVHERLWAIKYLILLALFGISLQSLAEAERFAEVEPFKTAIILHFSRDFGYVAYAAGLLLISVFNAKFYCRYLCPMGAALAIPARLQLFDWLRRRKECGQPCQVCANECEIGAIQKNGVINANECHYCLDCQVTYFNEQKCPPLVQKLKKRRKKAGQPQPEVTVEDIPVSVVSG